MTLRKVVAHTACNELQLTGHRKLRQWKNFQIKANSIISSSFEEVLYLDSDNIPLKDPTHLFESALYSDEGQPKAIFWPDLNKDHRKSGISRFQFQMINVDHALSAGRLIYEARNAIWRLTGRQCYSDEWEIESGQFSILVLGVLRSIISIVPSTSYSGQILISKSGNNGLNLAALHVAAHMQLEHQFYFRLSEGDKDTFVRPSFYLFCPAAHMRHAFPYLT